VCDKAGKSVFVKQAPGFVKVFGPELRLHKERMQLEVDVYREWSSVIPSEGQRYLPVIHHFDLENMAFIMEFLGSCKLLNDCLIKSNTPLNEQITSGLGEFMGLIHSHTHCSALSPDAAAKYVKKYENLVLRDIQLEFVFSKCFRESERAAHLRDDQSFMAQVDQLKALYKGEDTSNLALCHGDLHAGSVMVSDEDTKVIDPEFTVYGPPGLDLGSLFSSFVLAIVYHATVGSPQSVTADIWGAMEKIWNIYVSTMIANGISSELCMAVGRQAVGFTGCEVTRTALGCAGDRVTPIEDEDLKAKAENQALKIGSALIKGWSESESGIGLLLATCSECT